MQISPFTIINERPSDAAEIEDLHAEAFGPGQYVRTAYRLREGVPPEASLCFVALSGEALVGSVRLTPILIGGTNALLLGPLAVQASFHGRGAGRLLVRTALDAARREGHAAVLLVGDEPYYGPLGFVRVKAGTIELPGPVDRGRMLMVVLQPGADGPKGIVTKAR